MNQSHEGVKTPECLINKIKTVCGGEEWAFFRGEPKEYCYPVSSSIYRKYKPKEIFNEHFQPTDLEREIIEKVRRDFFSQTTSTVEILTELRHFGGDTALVDFSRSLFVALFFACTGDQESDGYVYVLASDKIKALAELDVHLPVRVETDPGYFEAVRFGQSRSRVEAQSSVFIRTRQGFVNKSFWRKIRIPRDIKAACLSYLARFHNINKNTVYNDLFGWITNQSNFETAQLRFYKGLANQNSGQLKDAIKNYDEAIRLQSDIPATFNNRGKAKADIGCYVEAIKDYDKVILLRPNSPEVFFDRGNLKLKIGDHPGARADFQEAIALGQNNEKVKTNAEHALQIMDTDPPSSPAP